MCESKREKERERDEREMRHEQEWRTGILDGDGRAMDDPLRPDVAERPYPNR